MKRVYFPICLSLLSMNGLVAAAQDAHPATRTVVMYGGPNQILTNVSSNGKWACGAQTDGSSDPIGFIWNLESNEITTLGVNTAAYAVSDNGVVVGTFLDSEASGNGAPVEAAHKLAVCTSAYVCTQNGAMPVLPPELTGVQ